MRKRFNLGFMMFMLLLCCVAAIAQDSSAQKEEPDGAEQAATLRLQLVEVQQREGELQARIQQLDEDLKPENIERATSGYGSTRPEELREQRRKSLELEKRTALAQLEQLAASRVRLEAAIANADALAYHQSAKGYPLNQVSQSAFPLRATLIAGAIAALCVIGLLFVLRRFVRNQV